MKLPLATSSATILVLSTFPALAQSPRTVHDYYVLNPGSLSATSSVNKTLFITGNGSVSGIEWVNYQVVLPSFSISIRRGDRPSDDSNGHWEVDSSTRYPATVMAFAEFNPALVILSTSRLGSTTCIPASTMMAPSMREAST
jgi:hypothetical protein